MPHQKKNFAVAAKYKNKYCLITKFTKFTPIEYTQK